MLRVSLSATTIFPLCTLFTHAEESKLIAPTKFQNIPDFLQAALVAGVQIGVPIVTLFYVYAGFLFVAARGNPSKLERAKMNLLYTTIGAIFILGMAVIASLLGATVKQLMGL